MAVPKPAPEAKPTRGSKREPQREPRPKAKNDPRLVAASRELRDRWLERINAEGLALSAGKYDVARPTTTHEVRLPRAPDMAALPAPAAIAA